MNYVEKLTDEELTYICNLITGKKIKRYFQNNPQKFSKIRPGFRPNGLSEKMAVKLLVRYRSEPFILSFLNEQILLLLKEIDIQRNDLIKEGKDSESALLLTLPKTVFSGQIDLYFKISEQSYPKEYIALTKSAVQLLLEKQESALSSVVEIDKSTEVDILNEQLSNIKAEWENAENNYIQDIEQLKSAVEEAQHKLADKERELTKANTKIEELKAELNELNRLEERAVSSGDMFRDVEYQFTSLCKVIYDYDGRLKLFRLSDIENGVILGDYLPDAPVHNKLYTKEKEVPGLEGFVGIWDWKAVPNLSDPSKDYILSVYKDKYIPIEIIIVYDCTSINNLVEKLENEIIGTVTARKMIFAYWNDNGMYEGLFCTPSDLHITENSVSLKSNVLSLPYFLLAEEDIFFIDKRYFHRRINIGRPSKIIRIKNPLEIVKDILVKRTTWNAMKQKGFKKNEYQNFNSFLRELPTDELYEKIMCVCECSMTEAKGFVEQFIENADKYLNNTDLDGEVLACCIKNHPMLMKACESLVEEKWRAENVLQIEKANEALKLVQGKTEQQSQILKEMTIEYKETKKRLDDTLMELGRQEKLAIDVEKKVSDRIEWAKIHAAEFIADMAFQFPASTGTLAMSQADISTVSFVEGEHLPLEELEVSRNWPELKETIRFELFEAGVSERYAEGLGAYMYAAYINHVPLLLAGPCAHDIADAFSVALFGRLAATLKLEGNYCTSIMEQISDSGEKVIVIENLFSGAWNPYLPGIIADKDRFYIGLHPYSEDLVIEPNSFFNYMMPLLTEHFVDKFPTRRFVGGYMDDGFQHYVSSGLKPYYNKLFQDMRLGTFKKNMLQQILTDMHVILQDDNADFDYIFVILPYAYVCDRVDVLWAYLLKRMENEPTISGDLFSYIRSYIGEIE